MRAFIISFFLVVHVFAFTASPQVYFSPQDNLSDRLVRLINEETESIQTAIYCFTHREIAKALIAAKKRGVEVEVIVDPFSVKARTPIASLANAGITVLVWSPPIVTTSSGKVLRSPLMHDKFCIFGNKKVWSGSFNFTYEATRSNAENALILDEPEVIASFQKHFEGLKQRGCISYKQFVETKNFKS